MSEPIKKSVKRARKQGYTYTEIKKSLRKKGHKPKDIQEAITQVKNRPIYLLLAIAAVIILLTAFSLGYLLGAERGAEQQIQDRTPPPAAPEPTDPLEPTPPTEPEEPTEPPPAPVEESAFITVQDGEFKKDGETFRFAGTNAYYLPNYQKDSIGRSGFVTDTIDEFAQADITVVRMWAFYDGYDCGYSRIEPNENVIQTSPGVYDEQALRDLDAVIAYGKEQDIHFILSFLNYWDELGGLCQYNIWAGLEPEQARRNMDFFMNNEQTQQWYKDYIEMLMNRENTVTGVAYKDEPAIMSWQIMSEGRNTGKDPQILADWYQEIAQYIKSISDNQLVSTGEEGFDDASLGTWGAGGTFSHPDYTSQDYSNTYVLRAGEGTSYVLNTQIPEIDFAWAHWYPVDYGFYNQGEVNQDLMRAQHAWLADHKRIAEQQGKPFVLGEYGYQGWGDARVLEVYNDLWSQSQQNRIDGTLLWQYTIDFEKCFEFGGNICWPQGRADQELAQAYHEHIQAMARLE